MYLLQADETNVDASQGDFFIYGGVALPVARLRDVHDAVQEIRQKYGFAKEDQFKFNTHTRPLEMSIADWTAAKAEVLERAANLDVDLIVYVVHHGIAVGVDPHLRMSYALNALIAHYDMRYLAEKSARGVVSIDRLDESFGYNYLRSRFQSPLELPDGRSPSLDRVLHYSMTCDGASHLSSVVDIAIGAVRYCVNSAGGKGRDSVAQKMFPAVARLMWHKMHGEVMKIGGRGFLTYPKEVKAPYYRRQYDSLIAALERYGSSGDE